jgi:hypothetical protein
VLTPDRSHLLNIFETGDLPLELTSLCPDIGSYWPTLVFCDFSDILRITSELTSLILTRRRAKAKEGGVGIDVDEVIVTSSRGRKHWWLFSRRGREEAVRV